MGVVGAFEVREGVRVRGEREEEEEERREKEKERRDTSNQECSKAQGDIEHCRQKWRVAVPTEPHYSYEYNTRYFIKSGVWWVGSG